MFRYRRLKKKIEERYKNYSDEELELEKEDLLNSLKILYKTDLEFFKSRNCKILVYKHRTALVEDLITSLGYKFVSKKNKVFVPLVEDPTEDELNSIIGEFINCKRKCLFLDIMAIVFLIVSLLTTRYSIINDSSQLVNILSVIMCIVSVSVSLYSFKCTRDANKIGAELY